MLNLDPIAIYRHYAGPRGISQITIARQSRTGNPFDPNPSPTVQVVWSGEGIGLRLIDRGEGAERDVQGQSLDNLWHVSVPVNVALSIQEGDYVFARNGDRALDVRGVLVRIDRRLSQRVVLLIDDQQTVPFELPG